MKDITDTNYYKIDTEAFEYSPHAPVSDEQVKLSKKFWTSKSEEEYYEYMVSAIKSTLELHRHMFEPITTDILDTIRYSLFAHPFEDGGACKKLRVFYNADKEKVQIDWKFNGNSYEVLI